MLAWILIASLIFLKTFPVYRTILILPPLAIPPMGVNCIKIWGCLRMYCAAETECRRLGKWIKKRNIFLTVLESGTSKIKVLASEEGLLAVSSQWRHQRTREPLYVGVNPLNVSATHT